MTTKVFRPDAEWRARLTPLQYIVTRKGAGERPGHEPHPEASASGTYACVCCGARLYGSAARVASDGGHPCFGGGLPRAPLALRPDHGWMRRRTRIACARCGAQLGFLAEDDGAPARHRINACALRFVADAPADAGPAQS